MIRPLYLDAALPWQVQLDDGPALHISAPGRARSLYALQRLSRVLSPTGAQWSTPALLACLRAGVPVIFFDGGGEPVAWCFGPRKRESTLAGLLRVALDHPQWADLLGEWQRAAQRREMLAAIGQLGVCSGRTLDAADVRARLCNHHRVRLGWPAGAWIDALCRANQALVAERLHGLLGDPALIGYAREGLHLVRLLAGLMEWQLHCILGAAPPSAMAQVQPGRFAAAALERHGAALHRCCGELIGSLEHHLRERVG